MKLANRFVIGMAALLALVGASLGQGPTGSDGVPVAFDVVATGGVTQAELTWAADPGLFYEIYATTNLASGPWTLAVAEPLSSTNLIGQMQLLSADKSRFFQVRKLDTDGPTITARYPGSGAVGVGLSAPLGIEIADISGINTNSIVLIINGNQSLTNGAPGLIVTTTGIVYDPAAASTNWGVNGATVTVSFVCLDSPGNPTAVEWSFTLESPLFWAPNIVGLGTLANPTFQPTKLTSRLGASVTTGTGYEIVTVADTYLVLSYTSESNTLALGTLLVSVDPDRLFYRRITGLTDVPKNQRVTVYTEDAVLTDLIHDGSFDTSVFTTWGEGGAQPQVYAQPQWGGSGKVTLSKTETLSVNALLGPRAQIQGTIAYTISGSLSLGADISGMTLQSAFAEANAGLDLALDANLTVNGGVDRFSKSIDLLPSGVQVGYFTAGPVVITAFLYLELCADAQLDANVVASAGMDITAGMNFGVNYKNGQWDKQPLTPTFEIPRRTFQLNAGVNGDAWLYLKPRLEVRVFKLFGADLDYRRGPYVTGVWNSGVNCFNLALYDRKSLTLGVSSIIGKGPEWTLWEGGFGAPLRMWSWPDVAPSAPVFTVQPVGGAYANGSLVFISASAVGNPAPIYQWYQNGNLLFGRTGNTLSFIMGSSAVGTYTCTAHNNLGTRSSANASIALPASAPAGMALIPAGSFQMGNSMDPNEGWGLELPVHTVYVSAFYMDKTEVTWGKWKEVRTYAAANGYDIGSVGAGKADSHPVHSVNWYDCVKWLNARSQMEGLAPCYRRGGVVYKAEQHDDIVCDWSANGYRLPTEAEWEKAARGGLSGRRFPWGDTIQHSRANYYSPTSYAYDTSSTRGYHNDYDNEPIPYTSPVGVFAANGYGLHDMAGNLWEWCWDWFDDYPSGSVSNPRGSSSPSPNWGSHRVIGGGGWNYNANGCRVAYRFNCWPVSRYDYFGFRAVRPPGQQ